MSRVLASHMSFRFWLRSRELPSSTLMFKVVHIIAKVVARGLPDEAQRGVPAVFLFVDMHAILGLGQ